MEHQTLEIDMEGKEINADSIKELIEQISMDTAGKKPEEIYRTVPHRTGFFVLFVDGTWLEASVVSEAEVSAMAGISSADVQEASTTLQ